MYVMRTMCYPLSARRDSPRMGARRELDERAAVAALHPRESSRPVVIRFAQATLLPDEAVDDRDRLG